MIIDFFGILVSSFCILISYLTYQRVKKVYAPAVFFPLMWGIISFGAALCTIFDIQQVSLSTWIIVFLGVVLFWVGTNFPISVRLHKNKSSLNENYILNKKLFFILVLLSLPLLFQTTHKALSMLQSGYTMLDIRAAYYGIDGTERYWVNSTLSLVFDKYLVGPFKMAMIPLTISYCLLRKFEYKMVIASVFFVICDIISSGGRFILLYVILQCVIGLMLAQNRLATFNNSVKKLLKKIVFSSLIGIFLLTYNRATVNNIFKFIYEYLCCCIPLFDYYIPKINEFAYGTASLNGVINPLITLVNRFIQITTPYESIILKGLNVQQGVFLSESIVTNAFVTVFFYMFLDFGFLGVIFESFFYGSFCNKLYINVSKNFTERNLALYLLMIQGLLKTIQNMPFSITSYTLGFIYILILTRKDKE